MDRSQEPRIHQNCQEVELLTSQAGVIFNRFNFTLSYHPGSSNFKPDALFHQFEPDDATSTILPPFCVIGAMMWGIESAVRRTLEGIEVPVGCP